MKEQSTTHNTFVIERSYPATPERVFAALADPAKKRRWFAEADTHDLIQFDMDFQVGGRERSRYRLRPGTPFPGVELASEGIYQDIVPNRRIVGAATMAIGGKVISAALTTFELLPTATGTDLIFTHQAAFFEGSDGPQMREHGWQQLLNRLAADLAA